MHTISYLIYVFTVYSLSSASKTQQRFLEEENDILTELNNLKGEMAALKALVGHTYVRWGRTTCLSNNGTEKLYSGYMVGDKWDQSGGGSNHLCVPEIPSWGKYVDGYNGGAEVRGTEIEVDGSVSTQLFGKPAENQDIPCAVCRANRASHVMIPGRTDCYSGWTKEYSGYIVASNPAWAANSDYVCLDSGLEFVVHGAGDRKNIASLSTPS
jgi:hypothetical protein